MQNGELSAAYLGAIVIADELASAAVHAVAGFRHPVNGGPEIDIRSNNDVILPGTTVYLVSRVDPGIDIRTTPEGRVDRDRFARTT